MTKSRLSVFVLVASFLWACGSDEMQPDGEATAEFVSISSFEADSLRVEAGAPVGLSWEVRNAEAVRLFANQEPVSIGDGAEGSIQVPIDVRTRFRLDAIGKDGRAVSRALVVETKSTDRSPVVLSFVGSPSEVDAGERSTLSWTTINATQVEIFDGAGAPVPLGGAEASEGSVEVALPDSDVTYRLVASGEEGATERTLFIKVRGTPRAAFGTSQQRVAAGETATLEWSVEEASRVVIREVGGEVLVDTDTTFQGSFEVSPQRSTTYELRATGAWKDRIETLTVDVGPELLLFEVEESGPIGAGKLATLRWQTAGAIGVEVSNLVDPARTFTGYQVDEGSASIPMTEAGRFQIRVVGGDGEEIVEETQATLLGTPSIGSLRVEPAITSQQIQPVRVVVSWSGIDNAESVTLVGDTFGRVGHFKPPFPDGEMELWLRETASLTLTATNSAGEASLETTATLVPLPSIDEFVLFPRHAAAGESTLVSWAVTGAQSVVLEWNGEEVQRDEPTTGVGIYSRMITAPGSFRIIATNSAGGVVETTRAVTVGAPEVRSFSAQRATVLHGQPLDFAWVNRGGVHMILERDGVQVFEATDPATIEEGTFTYPGTEMGRATFTLVLTNGLGTTVRRSFEVFVTDGPVIDVIQARQALACVGDPITLEWEVSNDPLGVVPTLTLTAAGQVVDLTGLDPNEGEVALTSLPLGMNELVLTAETPGRNADSRSVFVEVVEETSFSNVQVSPETVAPGGMVTISWDTICGEEVQIRTGAFEPSASSEPFVNVRGSGTFHPFTGLCGSYDPDDEGCVDLAFPDGFVFPFDGAARSTIRAYANGLAGFNLGFTGDTYSTSSIPASISGLNFAPFWEDLVGNYYLSQWGVDTQLVGTAPNRSFIVQWTDQITLWWWDADEILNFQLVLHEDGSFEFRYGTMFNPWDQSHADGGGAVIGYQSQAGTHHHQISAWFPVAGGLSNRSFAFDFPRREAKGSHTFRAQETHHVTLRAFGQLNDAETQVQIRVE